MATLGFPHYTVVGEAGFDIVLHVAMVRPQQVRFQPAPTA